VVRQAERVVSAKTDTMAFNMTAMRAAVGGCAARPAAPAAPVAVLPCFSGLGVANRLCLHAPGGKPCAACPLAPELARVLASLRSLRLGGPCVRPLQTVAS